MRSLSPAPSVRPAMVDLTSRRMAAALEPQEAFALHMEMTTKQIVLETHPETFFQTAHYAGHPTVLVRYDASDDDLIREMNRRAADWARAKAPPRPRKKRRLSRKL